MLGFAVVLAITAISMGIAYLGFERVSSGVTLYRNSVSEADLARDIDRELVSYRALARTFVATGKGDDSAVALVAEASLLQLGENGREPALPAPTQNLVQDCRQHTRLQLAQNTLEGGRVAEIIENTHRPSSC